MIMNINASVNKNKMLVLSEKLRSIEDNRLHSSFGYTINDLDNYLESVIKQASDDKK